MRSVEILLNENVDNLGIVGDVVKVRPGYARNYLLPRGLAIAPTKGNINRLASRRAEMEKRLQELRKTQEALLERLTAVEITIQRSANEQGVLFGSVSVRDVADVLRAEGYEVEDRAVRISQPIKRLDSYEVGIVMGSDLKTTIKLWVVSDKPIEEIKTAAQETSAEGAEGDSGKPEKKPQAESQERPSKKKSGKSKPVAAEAE